MKHKLTSLNTQITVIVKDKKTDTITYKIRTKVLKKGV